MATLTVIARHVKDRLKQLSPTLLKWVGLKLLTKAETEALMRPYQVSQSVKSPIRLARVNDVTDPQKMLFHEKEVETDSDFVWNFTNSTGRATVLRSGNLNIDNQFLDTDFGNQALLADLLKPDRRPIRKHTIVIAPWSHYWHGYFDYLLFVVGKLARIKAVIPPAEFDKAIVSYPLVHTAYESELLALLGITADRIVDSRKEAIHFERCIVANNSSWFYPAAADVIALKTIVEAQLVPAKSSPERRLYISRAGRRKVINENELTTMLSRYGFEVIEDKPRSIAEQIDLYRSASFILGPHGASFANLLWCKPGTQLLELFPTTYRPEYFRYLTQVLDIRYAAYSFGPVADSHYTFVDANIQVAVDEVERGLLTLLT